VQDRVNEHFEYQNKIRKSRANLSRRIAIGRLYYVESYQDLEKARLPERKEDDRL